MLCTALLLILTRAKEETGSENLVTYDLTLIGTLRKDRDSAEWGILLTATQEVRTNAVNLARMADDTKKTEIRLGAAERANGVRQEKSLNR